MASVVGTVASNLGITIPAEAKPSPLQTEQVFQMEIWFNHLGLLLQEVNWCMEVICHGLCLPLEDHLVIRSISSTDCERKDVMCVSLFQGLCQHLLRVALGPSAQSETLCPEVDPSRIDLQLDH